MKQIISTLIGLATSVALNAQTITYTNVLGTNSITCSQTSLFFLAGVTNYNGAATFTWTSANATVTGDNAFITTPGTYTISGTGANNVPFTPTIFTVYTNTTLPTNMVTPVTQTITCAGAAISVTGTAISPTVNITHQWSGNAGGFMVANSPNSFYSPNMPGTYTLVTTNNINGCTASKTMQIVSSDNFPEFTISSPQNFLLGCGTQSVTSLNCMIQTASGPVHYALQTPSGLINNISTYTTNVPGTYTYVVIDMVNNCTSTLPFSVIANNHGPTIGYMGGSMLTCSSPSAILTAMTSNTLVTFQWSYHFAGGGVASVANPTVVASAPGEYTLTLFDVNNGCVSNTIATISDQRNYPVVQTPPLFQIGCPDPTATIFVTVQSNSTSIVYSWAPSNGIVSSSLNSPSVTVDQPGTYNVVVTNSTNGCSAATQVFVEVCAAIATSANNKTEIQVFPNPGNGAYTLSLSNVNDNCRLDVYNALGENVLSQPVDGSHSQLDLTSERSGIYLIHVIRNGSTLCSTRVVKQ